MKALRINDSIELPARELDVSFARSSGPGGQNVNKVETKVRLRFALETSQVLPAAWKQRALSRHQGRLDSNGNLVVVSDRHRDQHRNLDDARSRMRDLLLECRRPPKRRKPTKPTKGSIRRRLDAKRRQSQKKRDRRAPLP